MPTNFTSVRTKGNLSVGISTAAVGLATYAIFVLGGNIATDSSRNTAPSQLYDSGSYLTYQEAQFVTSGSYVVAAIRIGSTTSGFASGALLHWTSTECNGAPVALSGSLAIKASTKMGMNQGTVLRRSFNIGSGGTTVANTGTVISTKIPALQYVQFTGTGGQGINSGALSRNDCKLKIWSHAKYGK